jgi:hypothetical protein
VIFEQLFQWLGYHIPALGAFIVCLLVVAAVCSLFYSWGKATANKQWKFNVEHMPQVIGQDIRERLERRLIEQALIIKRLKEKDDQMTPAFKSLAIIAEHFVQEAGK